MIARGLLAAVAVACLAVLGWWAYASLLEKRAQRISDAPFRVTDPRQAADAERKLERASKLNPDRRPDLARGQLLYRAGRLREAVRVLGRLTRDEPESVEAWGLLALAAREVDPARARAARARVLELNPLALERPPQ